MRFALLLSILLVLLAIVSAFMSWRLENTYPPAGAFIEVEGERLHYLDIGPKQTGAPTIVILHGASANLHDMHVSLGETLANQYRVILFDRPGRGYSTRPDDGHDLNVQSRLIHSALQNLEIENPILVGQSFGATVSLAYALAYQQDLSGLVLLAGVCHGWPGGVIWYNRVTTIPVIGPILRRTVVPFYGPVVAKGSVKAAFWPKPAPENYYENTRLAMLFRPKDFVNNATDIVHLKSNVLAMADRYEELKLPVRIFVGTHDTTVSPTIHSYTLSQQIDGAELTILPDTGHGLHHTASAEIIAGIESLASEIIVRNTEASYVPPAVNAAVATDSDADNTEAESAAQTVDDAAIEPVETGEDDVQNQTP